MYARKVFAVIVAITLVFGSFSFSFAADDVSAASSGSAVFTDLTGHWAAGAINKWAGYGIIHGSEGLFRPDAPITRGEMAVILDNMMDYQVKASNKFTDLQSGKFYTDAVLKANAAGIIKGDGATVRPNDKITREEAAVMLSRAFAVKEASSGSAFTDAAEISSWARGAIYGMESKGYINGYNGMLSPKESISRAAVVTLIDNIVKAYYTAAGTYTDNVNGTAVIKVTGVTLKGITVSENLIIAEGVADGDATLDSVTVKGSTIIRGGGENSIHITGTSHIENLTIEIVDGKVRVVADGVTIQEVDILEGEEIILDGSFGTITNKAPGAKLIVASGSTIDKVVANAKTAISGTGTLKTVEFKDGSNDSSVTTPNTRITVDSGVTGVTGGGGESVPEGSSGTNNSGGTGLTGGTTTGGHHNDTTVPTPSISVFKVTSAGVEVAPIGGLYTIDNASTATNTGIDVTISNTGNYTYTATITIWKGSKTGKKMAYASAGGLTKTYLDMLSAWDYVTFSDMSLMFDHLGTSHDGWYLGPTGDKVSGSDKTVFIDSITAMFDRMKDGRVYFVEVTLTPSGGSTGSTSFTIQKELLCSVIRRRRDYYFNREKPSVVNPNLLSALVH